MKKNIVILLIANILFFASCEEYGREPFNKDSAPPQVTDVQVESIAGGAILTYSVPNDPDLLYVKAVYTLADGTVREAKSSFYNNKLTLEGFFEAGEYKTNLYSVSRGGNMSPPLEVKFQTKTSPIVTARETLIVSETYGGIAVRFANDYRANLRFTILTKDESGEIVQADNYYTDRRKGRFAVRGYAPEERWFGVFIGDRWNNRTDTIEGLYTPLFEQQLPKPYYRISALLDYPGEGNTITHETFANSPWKDDAPTGHAGGNMAGLWDGIFGNNNGDPLDANRTVHTKPGKGFPQCITFDLGRKVKLSRVIVHHRYGTGYDGQYRSGDPKKYEIYGAPAGTGGDWENWTLLKCLDEDGEAKSVFESIKPSDSPYGMETNEDRQFASVDGEEFEFPEPGNSDEGPEVQYIRIRFLEVWGTLDYIYLGEMTFFGEIQ